MFDQSFGERDELLIECVNICTYIQYVQYVRNTTQFSNCDKKFQIYIITAYSAPSSIHYHFIVLFHQDLFVLRGSGSYRISEVNQPAISAKDRYLNKARFSGFAPLERIPDIRLPP